MAYGAREPDKIEPFSAAKMEINAATVTALAAGLHTAWPSSRPRCGLAATCPGLKT